MLRTATIAVLAALAGVAGLAPPAMAQGQGQGQGGGPASQAPASQAPAGQSIVTHVQTVRDLAAVCDPRWEGMPRLEAIAYCQGFLTSAGQYHALLYPRGGPARPLFCVPEPRPSIAQSGIAFAAWARENPTHANEPALDGLLRWAQAAYPCPPAPPAARRNNR